MTNEKRLEIALEHMLKVYGPERLKQKCAAMVDSLYSTLPKERGGSKVPLAGTSKGRARPSTGRRPGRAVGSLSINNK